MCGITAFLGTRPCLDILVGGLQRLEYRGYDSAGVCVVNDHGDKEADLYLCKKKGKVSNLRDAMDGNVKGTCGIAHTRWATHGPPNDVNAHPHVSAGGRIAVVHNGILENFSDLRQFVTGHGIALQSDTDTEVLVHLIELAKRGQLTTHKSDQSPGVRLPLHKAVAVALSQVDGTFGLAVVDADEPDVIVGARKGSPLLLGVGEKVGDQREHFLASDASAVVEYTHDVVYLEDGDMVRIDRHGYDIFSLSDILTILQRIRMPRSGDGEGPSHFSPLRDKARVMELSLDRSASDESSPEDIEPTVDSPTKLDGMRKVVERHGLPLQRLTSRDVQRHVHRLEISLAQIEKGGFKHFMLKEITDQPRTLQNCMRGRVMIATDEGGKKTASVKMGGLAAVAKRGKWRAHGAAYAAAATGAGSADDAAAAAVVHGDTVEQCMAHAARIIIVSCGTSWHAGLAGEYMIENLAGISVETEYASEFIYRNPILDPERDVLVAISQSGETADTLEAIRLAKRRGCLTVGVCNVVGSSIARETDGGVYLHAGPEIGVASTKAFTAQITVLSMIAMRLGSLRGLISDERLIEYAEALLKVPDQVQNVLDACASNIEQCSKEYRYAQNFLYLGRGYNFPVALEGALKHAEVAYVHAQGYPAAEMKHGPIALIDKFMPVVFIAPRSDKTYPKIRANVEEVLARGGSVIMVTENGNTDFDDKCDTVIKVPETVEFLAPIVTVVPLQLLSYHIADMRGCNVDQPRNLAKSVTVE